MATEYDRQRTLREEDFVHEAGQHMSAVDVEVVERAEHVRRYDRREVSAVLPRVRPVQHVDHALRVLRAPHEYDV